MQDRNGFGNDAYCKLLLRGNVLTDASPLARSVTNSGVSVVSDASFPGGKALSFGGSASMSLTNDSVFDLTGASIVGFDMHFKPTSLSAQQILLSKSNAGSDGWFFAVNTSGKIVLQYNTTLIFTGTISLVAGTKSHIYFMKSGDTHKLYVDGKLDTSVTTATRPNALPYLYIGVLYNAGQNLNGKVSGLRWFTNSVPWNRPFTPPTRSY